MDSDELRRRRTGFTSARRTTPVLSVVLLLLAGLLPLSWSNGGNARAQESDVPYGEVIVVLTDPRADAVRVARDEGITPRRVYQNVFRGFTANITQRRAEHLAKHPRVALISPISEFQAAVQTLTAGVDRVNADTNPVADIDGVDERVDADIAILDAGVDVDHPDLNVAGGVACEETGTYDSTGASGHGTHVAGIAAALDNDIGVVGVAPGARIWSVRVLGNDGKGTSDEIICGLDWVVAHADTIDVVNMSLAAELGDSTCWDDALHLAICNTVAAGVPVVAAAGNDGANTAPYVPATFDEVIAVSSFADFNGVPGGGGSRPSGCGTGADDVFYVLSNDGPDVDVVAPGVCVTSTIDGGNYGSKTGTSMATPHVAGAIALYKSVNPGASPTQVKAWLLENGESQTGPNGITGDTDGSPEPVLSVGQAITQAPPPEPGPPFLESNGQVVMEAEHAQALLSRDDHGWLFRNNQSDDYVPGYAGEGFVRVDPDDGGNWVSGYATAAPELQFEVQFAAPGTYHVWVRVQADDGGDDSLHAGIDDTAPASGEYIRPGLGANWAWTKSRNGGQTATITVPTAGLHTIAIWPREDGIRLDRVLLTTSATYTPTGEGPAESPQYVEPPPAFQETDGYVQFEAEDRHAQIDRANHDWRFENDVIAGYSGVGYLRVRPDNGDNWLSGFATTSPEIQFNVDFETTGTYYVWASLQATDAADDSFHVGLDGVPVSSATNMGTDGTGGGFRWSNRRGSSVGSIAISTPGIHTINFWAREDGLRLDQVILTTDEGFSPAGGSDPDPPADLIELEAEDFTNAIDRDEHAWTVETTTPGYSGAGYVAATPNNFDNWVSDYATTAPELQYTVDFPAAGAYQLWFLTQADGGGDNSLHAGLGGSPQASAENVTTGIGGWTWSSATIDVPTAGSQTLNIWAREDGLRLDRIILTTDTTFTPQAVAVAAAAAVTPSPTPEPTTEPTVEPTATPTAAPLPPFAEQLGVVTLEAEAFHANTPGGETTWVSQTDVAGFAGSGFMRAEPDADIVVASNYAATSPTLSYDVEFAGAGTYYLWVRGLATGEGDDTLHVGVDGQEQPTARALDLIEDGTWRWTNAAEGGIATVEIPGPGVHTVDVWMAEDGVRLDRLVLTADPAFVPDGQGPPASPRIDVAAASAAIPTTTTTPEPSPTATIDLSPTVAPTEEPTTEPTSIPTPPPATATPIPEPTATPPVEPTPTEILTEEESEQADGM